MNVDLAPGWVSVELDQVFEPRSSRVSPDDFPESPYVGLEHVEAHSSKLLGTVPASTMSSSAARFLAGDVLYGRMRPYLNKVVLLPFDGLASAEFIVFPMIAGVNNRFLLWRLLSSDFVTFACSQYEGDRPRVKFDQLGKFQLHLPPAAEQTRIVEKLEELLSGLDAGVAELKAAQKKLTRYRQSLLKAAVEGALTADWRAAQDCGQLAGSAQSAESGQALLARILTERRSRWQARQLAKFKVQGKNPPKDWQAKYPEPVAPDTAGLPALPLGWVWANVDQLSPDDLANGRSVPTAESGAKVLRLTAVKHGQIDLKECKTGAWSAEEAKPFAVVQGDLLIVRGNGSLTLVGRAGMVPAVTEAVAYPDTMIRLRVVESVVRPEWVGLLWDAAITRAHLESRARTSAGIYKISQPDIVSVRLPIPPLSEQDVMLAMFQQNGEEMQTVQKMVELGLRQSAAQRKNILKAAFSGQLVPQDPNDEPASALLARIRAERAAREKIPKVRQPRAVKETT